MAMGTEDYICLAKAVRAMMPLSNETKRLVAQYLALELEKRNPRFDPATFYIACGTWQEKDGIPKRKVRKEWRQQLPVREVKP